jgi:3-oxoadipate enol-lactonase
MHELFDLIGGDGTRLTAWRNRAEDGPRVLVCNGMGVPPEAWPRLLDDDCPFQVVSWNQRGVLGSDRPADPSRIEIADHVDDAVALLDAMGWDAAVVVGWSLGVNVAFELARAHPDRVSGLLSVAGVPGGTFDTILGPQLVPRAMRRTVGLGLVRTGRMMAPQLNLLGRVLPQRRVFVEFLRLSGVVLPTARLSDVQPWVAAMFAQEWAPYFDLAIALERHGRIDPSFLQVPVTIVAGELDALTARDDVLAFAAQIPHAEVLSLPGSHCLPLEYPEGMVDLIGGVVDRIEAQRHADGYLQRFSTDRADSALLVPEPSADLPAVGSTASLRRAWSGGRPGARRSGAVSQDLPWWASDSGEATGT